jgi:exosome complex component RRP4
LYYFNLYLRVFSGHGTYQEGKDIVSAVAGVVEQVNKLITVRPLRTRYAGEIGDVVVGRITEVGQRRWKVDVNARQDGVLLLSSVNLPGGVQVRRAMAMMLIMIMTRMMTTMTINVSL